MPIEDAYPALTSVMRGHAELLEQIGEAVTTGGLAVSTPLFREAAHLCRAADRLYRVIELELSIRLAEAERAPRRDGAPAR